METIIKILVIIVLTILFLFVFIRTAKARFNYETCEWLYRNNQGLDYMVCILTLNEGELNKIEKQN
ncbi:MAG: hypothetical protein KatS3mg096_800 [Candidatus Parcubacteria bacterium]|nr:MAG: hypothetical protein KatS3mg096_800 [Candidatus Parcubacteria bacterium]